MADPQIIGGIRAIAELKLTEDEEEDTFVNTWAFAMATPGPTTEAAEEDVADALDAFYTSINAQLGKQVGFIGLRTYDLGQAPPRDPTYWGGIGTPGSSAASLPSELAVALTFYATTPRPRNRGRVFVGPLRTDQVDQSGPFPRVSTTCRTSLATAASTLAGLATDVRWCVLSQRDGALKQITAGWIDDVFDIQRRRGEDPSDRTTWS